VPLECGFKRKKRKIKTCNSDAVVMACIPVNIPSPAVLYLFKDLEVQLEHNGEVFV